MIQGIIVLWTPKDIFNPNTWFFGGLVTGLWIEYLLAQSVESSEAPKVNGKDDRPINCNSLINGQVNGQH